MSSVAWRTIFATSVFSSFALVRYVPELLPSPKPTFIATFAQIWAAQVTIWVLWKVFLKPKYLSPLKHLPGPSGGSFWNGQFRMVYGLGTGEAEAKWMESVPNNGFIRYLSQLNQERLIVTSPTIIAEICMRSYEFIKPPVLILLAGRLLGIGLVLSERDQHKRQRKMFLPAFAPKHIKELYPTYWAKAKEVTAKLTDHLRHNDSAFEVGHWASRSALDIITLAAFGKDFGAIQDPESPLSKVYRTVLTPTRGFLILTMLKILVPAWIVGLIPVKYNTYQDEAVKTIRRTCREVLHEKKHKLANKSLEDKDILSVCLKYEEVAHVDEEAVIDQMTTFLAAGHETIAVGITWAIYMLCVHPEWQSRLRDEARTTISPPTGNSQVTSTDVERMPYLQAFCNEVLRWYPPIPATMREATADCVLDNQFIPKGTRLFISIKGMNRDERFWGHDAKLFKPERWLGPDNRLDAIGGCNTKYGYLSFMQGPRNCVAQAFSKAEMACMVGAWISRFEFRLDNENLLDETKMEISGGSFSGKPLHGLHVKARILEDW
ncbi:uncharacterized protein K452DRAFT_266984 [Aplosporella prunicola CBS 121167]|uniref:Cytochrome P450 n=1 Tax=Aplosporella prunicola CBS 121167 TaxID=1176127 RepID=A0A6A6BNL3_9PEZI|nr:uncharacterized protein K452DRAFT_266984 [Aplosporella prunicola CBS 121167]KAF2144834.1 hypothetical protein K452DRAFT_266984 [Aplosporella prunicola CBS 121167]